MLGEKYIRRKEKVPFGENSWRKFLAKNFRRKTFGKNNYVDTNLT